ncbi:MAG TPA: benzoate-CoA ligase family protein [Candidatus Acidoferrum sp.]|nr:benzoate-CoA ligase family protein [Candidatus Acidoferrum sp.]
MNPEDTLAFNLTDYFVDRHIREGRAQKVAIRSGASAYTYGMLAADINRAGNGLLRLGLQAEQRVLLLLPDCPEFVIAYFAVMKIGAVAVPTSTAGRTADYDYFLRESETPILIVHSSLFPEVTPILDLQPSLRHVIVVGEPRPGRMQWNDWLSQHSHELDAAPTTAEDVAFWLWTSGSTGLPKAAVHLHYDWIHCCRNYSVEVLGIGPDDTTFSSSKLFHAYGLGNGLMFPFYVGASTVLFPGKVGAKAVLEIAQAARPTLFFSVPTLYAQMLQEAEKEPYCLDSIRLAVSAAEPLPAEIFRRWQHKFGMEILDGIGSTEALHIYLSARPGIVKPGSTGTVVPGYKLRIVDSQNSEVSPGTMGELHVSGGSIAPYYWNHRKLTSERMLGPWFSTGDKFWMDEDGYYWYAGRSDDMFRVSGQWVSPFEVESALIEHASVLEAAVVAFREDTELYSPKAFVVVREGIAATPELSRELQEFVKRRIAPYKYPRHIEFTDKLPKTAAGKVLRYKLRALASGTFS